MSRSVGAVDVVHSLVPEEAALLLGLLTQLGDVWFLLGAVAVAYWLRPGDRRRTAVVLGIAIATIGVLEALKGAFALPRPATPLATADAYPVLLHGLFEATATAGGHGFPSGHATLSTVVWLGLAGAVRIGRARRRAGIAVALIVLIALSRIALGVHFLVDVLTGILLGLAVLAGAALALRVSPADRPTTAFGAAVVLGAIAVLVTAPSLDVGGALAPVAHDSLLALCGALGAIAGWQGVVLRALQLDGASRDGSGRIGGVGDDSAADEGWRAARLLVCGSVLLGLLALAVAGAVAGALGAASAGVVGWWFAVVVAVPGLVPSFDSTLGGYVPQWVRGSSAGTRE